MNMKRILPLLLSLAMALALCACGSQSSSDGAQTSVSGSTGVEDGVLTVGMECAYAPYNWTQMDDSNGAVPISNVPGSYANGYDVMIAKKICEANGWKLEIVSSAACRCSATGNTACPAIRGPLRSGRGGCASRIRRQGAR